MKKFKNWYLIIITGVAILLLILNLDGCKKQKMSERDTINLVNAMNDTIRVLRLDDTMHRASISVMQVTTTELFRRLESSNDEIIFLQKEVDDYKGKLKKAGSTIAVFENQTKIKKSSKTEIVYIDSIRIRDSSFATSYVYPTYKSSVEDQWLDYKIVANRDSVTLNLKTRNKYTVVIGTEKGKTFAEVKSFNPYSETTAIRAMQVSMPKPKKWGLGVNVSVTPTLINKTFKIKPYMGVGIQRNFIRF